MLSIPPFLRNCHALSEEDWFLPYSFFAHKLCTLISRKKSSSIILITRYDQGEGEVVYLHRSVAWPEQTRMFTEAQSRFVYGVGVLVLVLVLIPS